MRWILGVHLAVVMAFLLVQCDSHGPENSTNQSKPILASIEDAVESASLENKLVLLYFWGNWCSYCRQLDKVLNEDEMKGVLDKSYLLLRVDVGDFDKNMEALHKYIGEDAPGIPALAVLRTDGTIRKAITGEEWGKSDREVREYIKPFLEIMTIE